MDAKVNKWKEIETNLLLSRPGMNLVVLENGQLLKDGQWELILRLAQTIVSMSSTTLLLVVTTTEENPDTTLPRFRPFVEKGRYVECKKLTDDGLKKYCQTDYGLEESAAEDLLELCSNDFSKINNELEKLAILEVKPITSELVKKLVVFSAEDLLVSHLLHRNKELAMKVVHVLKEKDCIRVLSILANKLMFLRLAYSKDTPGIGPHQLAANVGVQAWQLLEFFKIKRFWNLGMLDEKLSLLCELESVFYKQKGNILHFLVKWW